MPDSKDSFADLFLRPSERADGQPRTGDPEKQKHGKTAAVDKHLVSMRKQVGGHQPETIVTEITTLNSAVEQMRVAAKLERAELAKLLDVSFQYVYQLETGRRGILPETIKRFADALGYRMEIRFIKAGTKAKNAPAKGRSKK